MNAVLKVQGKLKNSRELSVDLLVIDKMGNIVFPRSAIDSKVINRGLLTSSEIAKITSERNIYDVNQVLKDRDLAIDGDIMDDIVNIVMKVVDIYDDYELEHIVIRKLVKLKSI
jgi:hypothetical protein